MCFSEEASFLSSALLATLGAFSLSSAKTKNYYPLAAIPLFFALQQFSEGIQWLVYKNIWGTANLAYIAKEIFTFIAYPFWPFWIPFSLWLIENKRFYRRILLLLVIVGIPLSLYFTKKVIFYPFDAYILNKSIYYNVDVERIFLIPYTLTVVLPWFFSTLPLARMVGILIAIVMLLTAYFFFINFVSIWCFFSSLISVTILFGIRKSFPET